MAIHTVFNLDMHGSSKLIILLMKNLKLSSIQVLDLNPTTFTSSAWFKIIFFVQFNEGLTNYQNETYLGFYNNKNWSLRYENQIIFNLRALLLINLMNINTNSKEEDPQTIQYIRTLANYLTNEASREGDSDSFIYSKTESDCFTIRFGTEGKKKKKKMSPRYTSPYKQQSISIQKIMKTKGKNDPKLIYSPSPLEKSVQKKHDNKNKRKNTSPSKYRCVPPLIAKIQQNQAVKMKTEARFIFEKRDKQTNGMSLWQKKQKWADFLLRERRWEEEKQNKMMNERQRVISRERENMNTFTPRSGPRLNVEEHIKSVKRRKIKLQQQLREFSLNYFTWQTHSPLKRRNISPHTPHPSNLSREIMVQVQSKRELGFLLSK